VPIGRWVVQEACRQNKAWQDRGLPAVIVCVNVSARQFLEGSVIECVLEGLRASGLEAHYLELELTESLIMQTLQQAVDTMQMLRRLGANLSIDDFGTGYSSLAALKTFPINRLKIDKSFIDDVCNSESDKAVIKAIVALGRNLNLRVIAEGVETIGQVAFLRESKCDEMQGYYISKPVEAHALESCLRDWALQFACSLDATAA
jgi:EAL domain-containing protein (putative c-di-GMP-specific phosphodiesterase class I)